MPRTVRLRRRNGFTVVELIVSMVVLATVVGASTMTLLRVQRQYTGQRTMTESREALKAVEVVLQRAFRSARVNPANMAPANVAMVVNPLARSGSSWNNVDLRGDFNPVDGTVNGDWEDVRVELTNDTVYVRYRNSGTKEPVAYPVSQLRFQFYAQDGTEITSASLAAANARRVKVTMAVPVPQTSTILRRELLVYLRN
jgi:prepilin-type N-terminal cleavage/methylation domain-containing protein